MWKTSSEKQMVGMPLEYILMMGAWDINDDLVNDY